MAYVKVDWRKDIEKESKMPAKKYEKYLLKERGSELVVNCYNCVQGQAVQQFEKTQSLYGKDKPRGEKGVNLAFEVIHSFIPEESKNLSAEKINSMGLELAKRYFSNHEFTVVTHTDQPHHHNHILVNPVNEKTGKRDITDKKIHLDNLRAIANDISRENGLSVIRLTKKEKERNIPKEVRKIQRRGGKSYRLDLFQKANFARSYATNFDEYVSILNELSVKVAITEKTISYYYEGHEKGIRGKQLGAHYDKFGLIEKFKSNDELFFHQPQVRRKIRDGISNFKDGKRDTLGTSSSLSMVGGDAQKLTGKDYESYTKSDRRSNRNSLPSDHALRDSIVPISEIKRASNSDILDYCKRHNIAYNLNGKGETVLKGREHVVINGNRWTNTKNKTTGSLIELVSFHDETTYLKAISKITGNKNLLLLEQHFGEVKRPYQSFYIPKIQKENPQIAMAKVKQFFKHHKMDEGLADDLFKQKRVQVDKKGSIWFYTDEDHKEGVQYTLDSEKNYKAKHYGKQNTPLIEPYGYRNCVTVYTDFLNFLKFDKGKSFTEKSQSSLLLKGLDEKSLHIFLVKNPKIERLEFIQPKDEKKQIEKWNFINRQKKQLKSFNISVETISRERAIERESGFSLGF